MPKPKWRVTVAQSVKIHYSWFEEADSFEEARSKAEATSEIGIPAFASESIESISGEDFICAEPPAPSSNHQP